MLQNPSWMKETYLLIRELLDEGKAIEYRFLSHFSVSLFCLPRFLNQRTLLGIESIDKFCLVVFLNLISQSENLFVIKHKHRHMKEYMPWKPWPGKS